MRTSSSSSSSSLEHREIDLVTKQTGYKNSTTIIYSRFGQLKWWSRLSLEDTVNEDPVLAITVHVKVG